MSSTLRSMRKPVGVLILNDRFAAGLSFLCQDLRLEIPSAVKILGVDDLSIARAHQLALSSIRTPGEQIGGLAMRTLHRLLDGRRVSRASTPVPASELVGRKSTLGKIPGSVRVADSRDYIARHACADLTVGHVAQTMGISRRTFELQFRAFAGHSPREEIQRVRLKHAQALLRETLYSVSRIASMIGFAETAAFSKFFRKQTGTSPANFARGSNSPNCAFGQDCKGLVL